MLFLAVILVISVSHVGNFKLDASADTLILEDDKDLKIFRETNEKYKSSDFLVLTVTDNEKEIFAIDTLSFIDSLSNELTKIKNVASVTSITNIPLVTSSKRPLTELINDIPNIMSEGINKSLARKEILTSPIYNELVISSDGKTTAIQISIEENLELLDARNHRTSLFQKYKSDSSFEIEYLKAKKKYIELSDSEKQKVSSLIKEIRSIQYNNQSDRYEIRLGGIPMITDDMVTFIRNDLINFGLGVLVFILITLIIIFRKIIGVSTHNQLPLCCHIYDWSIRLPRLESDSDIIKLHLIDVNTYTIDEHTYNRSLRQIYSSSKGNKYEAIKLTTERMIWPCLYTH